MNNDNDNSQCTGRDRHRKTDNDSTKFYCHWVLVSVNTSMWFHTSHLLPGLVVGLGLAQCEDIIIVNTASAIFDTNRDVSSRPGMATKFPLRFLMTFIVLNQN